MRKGPEIFLLLLLCFFITESVAQENTSGTIRVRKPADLVPRIAGKSEGKITPGEICSKEGIYVTTKGVRIIAFEINYFSGREFTETVEGNRISSEKMCLGIANIKNGDQVHIYNILASDSLGRKFNLTPMRFEIDSPKDSIDEVKVLYVDGFYQEKLPYIPIKKQYIKLGNMTVRNSGPAWNINSPGEPVVLNQFYENTYRNEGVTHGRYSIIGKDSVYIDFSEEYSICDYGGKIINGRLELRVIGHDGQIYDDRRTYIILPFSRKL